MIYFFTSKKDTNCKLMKPIIDRLQRKYIIEIIDIDEHRELVKNFEIKELPTLVKRNGRLFGIASKQKIVEFLNSN